MDVPCAAVQSPPFGHERNCRHIDVTLDVCPLRLHLWHRVAAEQVSVHSKYKYDKIQKRLILMFIYLYSPNDDDDDIDDVCCRSVSRQTPKCWKWSTDYVLLKATHKRNVLDLSDLQHCCCVRATNSGVSRAPHCEPCKNSVSGETDLRSVNIAFQPLVCCLFCVHNAVKAIQHLQCKNVRHTVQASVLHNGRERRSRWVWSWRRGDLQVELWRNPRSKLHFAVSTQLLSALFNSPS